jgi:hypothetical protein
MTTTDPEDERALWARFTSGAALEAHERARLARWIEDEQLLDELLDDVQSDRALRALPRLAATHEEFVERTWARAFAGGEPVRRALPLRYALGAAAALALLACGWFLGREQTRRAGVPIESVVDAAAFATLTPRDAGVIERVGSGRLRVPASGAELRYDGGASFAVEGPAELDLVSPHEILFASGEAEVELTNELASFVVRTPTSRIKDAEAQFHLAVRASGETELVVERGQVALEPGRPGAWPGRVQRLSPSNLKRARVRVLQRTAEDAVLASAAEGQDRRFSGLLVAQGRVLEYELPQLFERASQRVVEVTRKQPEFFYQHWKAAAEQGEPLQIHWANGPVVQLGSITGLKQLEKLAETFEHGFDLESWPAFVAPHAIAVEGQPLQVIEVRVPTPSGRAPSAPRSFRGTVVSEKGLYRVQGHAELKRYAEERLRALKVLELPVEAGGD